MSKVVTNIIVLLGLATVAFAGYYLYTKKTETVLKFTTTPSDIQNLVSQTQVFIERDRILKNVKINVSFFSDRKLLSLQDYRTEIIKAPVGRSNPFEEPELTIESVN